MADFLAIVNKLNEHTPQIIAFMIFVLYILCFVGLYQPYLEIISFGLFFVLHIIMSFGIVKMLHGDTTAINIKFINIRNLVSIWSKMGGIFTNIWSLISFDSWLNGFKSSLVMILALITFIVMTIGFLIAVAAYLCALPLQLPIILGWNGVIQISWVLFIGLILLLVSMVLMLITISKLRGKRLQNSALQTDFLPGGYSIEKQGYRYMKQGSRGEGYYILNKSQTLFGNDVKSAKNKNVFKILAILITVFIWVQILLITTGIPIEASILNGLNMVLGITIIILSSISVWITQRLYAETTVVRTTNTK
jgi:hypothetical protein